MAREAKATFKAGSTVEVSPEEAGFLGSFYRATVVEPLSSSADSYLVRYHTLLSDASQPLTERVPAALLRPLPPRRPTTRFALGDDVDAYNDEGWWSAVVTADLGGGKFELFFRGYKEQLVFEEKDLRLHRDWVDGVWVPAFDDDEEQQQQQISQKLQDKTFGKGMRVEVSSDEEGFEGAWFSATILEPVAEKKGKFLVEYQSLRTEDDESLLREEIDEAFIRHCPPETAAGDFRLLEEVDCLYNDGWWVGVVSAVLGDSKYKVYFKTSKEETEFLRSEMRLHQELIDGEWVIASQALNL